MITKPFVVLTGPTGTDKTAFTQIFAVTVSEDVDEQYLRLTVQPSWLDEKPLLGYYNPQTDKYVSTPFLNFLLKATENPGKPHFLCLDGMNLSPAERYFNSLLSAMESLDSYIHLHGFEKGSETGDAKLVPPRVKIPDNLLITGIINTDESLYQPSPRITDLANTIECSGVYSEFGSRKGEKRQTGISMQTLKKLRKTPRQEEKRLVLQTLSDLNQITEKHGFPISQRVRREFVDYVANSLNLYSLNEQENMNKAIDLQIKQRILPKIAGNNALEPLLDELRRYFKDRLPTSKRKTDRMKDRLAKHGSTSFYT
jgi:5-methylcytosine-specific restriction endonuclease McrBC GTP-binding regulatory subunit McrB